MSNSNVDVIHSLIDTIKNVASLAQLDFFVIFQGNTVSKGVERKGGILSKLSAKVAVKET